VQEQIDRASVEPVDAARVSSWLAATGVATVTGQHAARASPSDATSSMQQPQTLREGELLRAEAAEGQLAELQKQNAALKKELEKVKDAPQVEDDDISMKEAANKLLSTVIYYLGSIDSMIRLYFPRLYIRQHYLVSRRMTGRGSRLTLCL
jgi:hypothetical protein